MIPSSSSKLRLELRSLGLWTAFFSVLLSLLLCFFAVALMRGDLSIAASAFAQMFWGGFGDLPKFLETADWSSLARPWGELKQPGASRPFAPRAGLGEASHEPL